jgi:hypothetical protein
MFFKFSQQEVINSKNLLFPLINDFELSSFIINSDNNSNLIKFSISVRDSYKQPKIFNILNTKKYMKIKVFEILNEQQKTSLSNIDSITKLNKFIYNNKLNYVNINAGYDFVGDIKNKNFHYLENGFITLKYDSQYSTSNNLNNYSVGIVFYYDYSDYSNENETKPSETSEKTLFGTIKVINIFQNSQILSFSAVQDLRVVNSIFNKNLNFDSLIQQESYSKVLKLLSEKQFKNVKIGQYFSNGYFSRKLDGNLGILFNVNKYKLLKENSQYINNFIDSPLGDQYLKQCKISSIKILRRQTDKKDKTLYDKAENSYIKVIESGQIGDYIQEKDTIDGSIKQIDLSTDNTSDFITFEAVDKKIFLKTSGFYEYGVQISLLDGFTQYLQRVVDLLNKHNVIIKNYLEQTHKTVSTGDFVENFYPHNESRIISLNGYYDVIADKFTNYFKSFVYKQNFERDLLEAVKLMVSVIKFFNKDINEEQVILSLVNMINPAIATTSTINYFLQTHTKFTNQISMLINNNTNTFIEVENWFKNEIIDCNKKINIGYSFLDLSTESGLGQITGEVYKNKILNDIKRYGGDNSLFPEQIDRSIGFVAPEIINSKNFILNLNNIDSDINYYDSFNYSEIELDIKNYLFSNNQNDQYKISNTNNQLKPEIQTLKQKMNSLFSNFGIVNPNSLIYNNDLLNQRQNNNSSTIQDNNNCDPILLFLSLSKNLNLEKNDFNNKQITKNTVDDSDPKYLEILSTLPPCAELIFRNKSKVFQNDFKYLNDLTLNSKFLLLFNTIHKVEILTYPNGNIKNELWQPLTKTLVNTLNGTNNYLCRLTPIYNPDFNLQNFNNIELPIYNKYFILTNINPLKSVSIATIELPKNQSSNTLNRQLLNVQPVVERYSKSFESIPLFSLPPSSEDQAIEDQQESGIANPPPLPEDTPIILVGGFVGTGDNRVDEYGMLINNPFPAAFPADDIVLDFFTGDPNNPSKIPSPDFIYRVADGKGGFKKSPSILELNSRNNVYSISADGTITIKDFGLEPTGESFIDGKIYKLAYNYYELKKRHEARTPKMQEPVVEDNIIKSKDEVDATDSISQFDEPILGHGKHYSIGHGQIMGKKDISGADQYQLKSKNGRYAFTIDNKANTRNQIRIVDTTTDTVLWNIDYHDVKIYQAKTSFAGLAAIGGNVLESHTINEIAFYKGQLTIDAYVGSARKIILRMGPYSNDTNSYMILQDDGNLVIYNGSGVAIWESSTYKRSYGPKNLNPIGQGSEVRLDGLWGGDSAEPSTGPSPFQGQLT